MPFLPVTFCSKAICDSDCLFLPNFASTARNLPLLVTPIISAQPLQPNLINLSLDSGLYAPEFCRHTKQPMLNKYLMQALTVWLSLISACSKICLDMRFCPCRRRKILDVWDDRMIRNVKEFEKDVQSLKYPIVRGDSAAGNLMDNIHMMSARRPFPAYPITNSLTRNLNFFGKSGFCKIIVL